MRHEPQSILVRYEVDLFPGYIGLVLETKWLNEPDQSFLDQAQKLLESYPFNPGIDLFYDYGGFGNINDTVFMSGRHWLEWVYIEFQNYYLPLVILKNSGLHVLELSLNPFFRKPGINDESEFGEFSITADNIVKSAPFSPVYICADVYAQESSFQSAVCSFEPTNAQQFLLKTVLLDCPLVQAVPYVKAILTVQDVAGVICSFMKGEVAKVATTLGGKYLAGVEGLSKDGLITLTESEKYLFKVKSWVDSLKKVSSAGWNTRKHFDGKQKSTLLKNENMLGIAKSTEEIDWPDSLDMETMLKTVNDWSSGLFLNATMAEHEAVVVMGAAKVAITGKPDDMVVNEGEEVSVFMFPKNGGKLSFTTDGKVYVTNIQSTSSSAVVLNEYELNSDQQSIEIFFEAGSTYAAIDEDMDGIIDKTISPIATTSNENCKVDINDINISGIREVGSPVTFSLNSQNSCRETIYYRFSVHPDYGTDGYNGLKWLSMTPTEYVTENTVDYTFDKAGKYIVVAWAKNDSAASSIGVPIVGTSIEIKDNASSGGDITINGISVYGTKEVDSSITFTINAQHKSNNDLYYRFSVHPDYGSDAYDSLQWTSMTSTEYVSTNTINYQFAKAGKYIVVAWVVDDVNNVEASGMPIIGWSIDIDEVGEEPYFPF